MSILGGLISTASASSTSCKDVEFSNGVTVCVNIEDAGTDRRELTADVDGWSTSSLRCDIMTPDSILTPITSCNGEFDYDEARAGRIKLWIRYSWTAPSDREGKPSSSSVRTYPQWVYDFDNEERAEDDLSDDDDYTSSYDADNFYINASPSSPDEDEAVDITVRARDGYSTDTSYRGTVNFTVQRKSGSSRVSASSSLYDLDRSSYRFTSSDDGRHTFSNLVTFKDDSYDYRLLVRDDDDSDIDGTKEFIMNGSSSSNYDADNFYLTTDDTTPTTSQYVDLTVRARDNASTDTSYRGTVQFEVYYKAASSSTWTKTTSSTYYTMVSTYEDNGYTFTSSNNGSKTFSNLIKFNRNNFSYKVVVYDEDDESIEGYTIFNVGTTSSSSDVNGFTTSELNTVESLYDGRDNMISKLESDYSRLRNSTSRQNMSDDFKTAMEEIIDDDYNKTYDNYDDFMDGWLEWYRYTVSIR